MTLLIGAFSFDRKTLGVVWKDIVGSEIIHICNLNMNSDYKNHKCLQQ